MKRGFAALVAAALFLASAAGNASMEMDGAWKAGVWASTVWADGAWSENAPSTTMVPDVIGDSLAEADSALEAVGLDTGTVTTRCSSAVADEVLSQYPAAGSLVPDGSRIDLSASNGTPCASRPHANGLHIGIGIGL